MIYFFIAIILLLLCFAFYINIQFYRNKKEYQKKIAFLEDIILDLSNNYEKQNQKIKISEDVKAKLELSNESLSNLIYNLNTALFEELYPKKQEQQ